MGMFPSQTWVGGMCGLMRFRFGAVLEEFEVRDALMTVFAGKGNGSGSNNGVAHG
jgi:hypothetical protein